MPDIQVRSVEGIMWHYKDTLLHNGLPSNFILLSVMSRARVLVLASNFNLDDLKSTTLDKYGCLP